MRHRPPFTVRWPRFTATALLLITTAISAVAADSTPPDRSLRLIALAPHLAELAFAAGAGDQIVATVEYSDYPDEARNIPRIGDAFRVDLERLVSFKPDVVLAWEAGTPQALIDRIEALDLRVTQIATHRLADVSQAVRRIGEIAGTNAVAASAAARFEQDIQELRAQYQRRAPLSVFLQVNDRPLYTVNGEQIMSEVITLCGGRNVFASLRDLAPVVSVEAVIASNPQVILSTDYTAADPTAQWRTWQHIDAVRAGNVYALRSDDITRSTTRLVAGARDVCRTLDTARARLNSMKPR